MSCGHLTYRKRSRTMNHLKKLLWLAVFVAVALPFAAAESKADELYAKYGSSITSAHDYLKAFVALRDDVEIAEKSVEALGVLESAEKIVAELTAAMPDGFSAYQNTNPVAAEAGFSRKMSFLG